MNIVITEEAAEKLRLLLKKEGSDAVVRIREAKIGDG